MSSKENVEEVLSQISEPGLKSIEQMPSPKGSHQSNGSQQNNSPFKPHNCSKSKTQTIADLERQVYFWKKCCEEKEKEISHLNSQLQSAAQNIQVYKEKESQNVKKRKHNEIGGNSEIFDSSTISEYKKLRVDHSLTHFKLDMIKRILLFGDNAPFMEIDLQSKKPQISNQQEKVNQCIDSEKVYSADIQRYKQNISMLEDTNAKNKKRIEELEKSLKEVLMHVLEQRKSSETEAPIVTESQEKNIDECILDIGDMVDDIESGEPNVNSQLVNAG